MISSFLNHSETKTQQNNEQTTSVSKQHVVRRHIPVSAKNSNLGNIQSLLVDSTAESNAVKTDRANPHQTTSNNIADVKKKVIYPNNPSVYRGLKNLGATCYMNSILQVLFHIPLFRKMIFNIKPGEKDEDRNILLHLQRVFALLQLSDYSVSTRNLARSFGWTNIETMAQQDIHEFDGEFLNKLDSEIRKIPENSNFDIISLFKGKYVSVFQCRNVDYTNQKFNEFLDLDLHVKGISSLEESFLLFTSLEPLEGNNQYSAGSYGQQDADFYTKLVELPPVLQLHLMRFDCDPDTHENVKIDTFFSFPKNIDLRDVLIDRNMNAVSQYELFGVLVHAGNIISGHYTAYLRPTPADSWFYFNDSEVHEVSESTAIENNFGGPDPEQNGKNKSYCAYMLIYIRTDYIDKLYFQVSNSEISNELKIYVRDIYAVISMKKEKKERENSQVKAYIVQVADLEYIADKTGRILFESNRTMPVERSMTLEAVYEMVAVTLETHPLFLTIWVVSDNMLQCKLNRKVGIVDDIMQFSFNSNSLKLFVEIDESQSLDNTAALNAALIQSLNPSYNQPFNPSINSNLNLSMNSELQQYEIVVLVYSYFPTFVRPFKFVSTVSVTLDEKVSSLFDSVRVTFDVPDKVRMKAYIVTDTNSHQQPIQIDDCETTIGSCNISNGSVIVIQPNPYQFRPAKDNDRVLEVGSNSAKVSKQDIAFSFMPDFVTTPPVDFLVYFEYLNNNRYITARLIEDPDTHIFLRFPESITVSVFKNFIANAFDVEYNEDFDFMGLYWKNSSLPILSHNNDDSNEKISSILLPDINEIMIRIFHSHSIHDILSVRRIIIHSFLTDGVASTTFAYFHESTPIPALLNLFNAGTKRYLRILQYNGFEISMPLINDKVVADLTNPIRIECIPKDQLNMPPTAFLIQVFQVKPGSRTPIDHLAPFLIHVLENDKFHDVKKRMKKYLKYRKVKESNSRFFVRINDKNVDLSNDFNMYQLKHVGSPIYIGDHKKSQNLGHNNGVKIYTE
ncbi:hypothetical protein TRFO_31758 [Tritrichomonas foetus]|uniref:ubiquitinyl hydrolase 1 n=1 Tax=Tritrichomonas foetus TaxID=1144522 RepID=A0A1J4JRQ8_9EUKA|nr:hypothetical protein TRFO_31758 [Tritrichomonas foetus]|eukprot:OHT01434.1 hypothetical protein TRFO_31758 [Tritrichomonas foetus]